MIRFPAVAGRFYPGSQSSLTRELAKLVPGIAAVEKQDAIAVVSPHAGYIYSGAVAGETLARVKIPAAVIILGPNHHGHGAAVAVMAAGAWQMPMGDVPINEELAAKLLSLSGLAVEDEVAHRFEHSLEVQVPFLQYLQKDLTIIPIVLSRISCEACLELGKHIAAAIKSYGKPVLIVASTDMTHYESRVSASAKDQMALEHIERLDPEGLYSTVLDRGISMCGVIPTTTALAAAKELGAGKAEIVRYTDSGETSGDIRQVVGYAGIIIS